jgi:hypothetical protein
MFFGGSRLRSSFIISDSVTACREKLCSWAGEKEGEASGLVTLDGMGDEEEIRINRNIIVHATS